MNNENKLEFKLVMEGLGEVYSKKVGKDVLRLYWDVLISYPMEWVGECIRDATGRYKFFPKPAELVYQMGITQYKFTGVCDGKTLIDDLPPGYLATDTSWAE